MNSERTRIVVHRSRNAASKKHNLRSKLLLFSSPIVSLSPIKEEPGPGNTMGILSASCHGAFATVVEANSAMNPYLTSSQQSNAQDDSGVFDDFEDIDFDDKNSNSIPNQKKKTKLEPPLPNFLPPINSFTSPTKSVRTRFDQYCSKSADYHSLKKIGNQKMKNFPTRESCKRVLFAEEDEDSMSEGEEEDREDLSDIKPISTKL